MSARTKIVYGLLILWLSLSAFNEAMELMAWLDRVEV